MIVIEWITRRLVEAVVLAVFLGTIVVTMLAISGEFDQPSTKPRWEVRDVSR